MRDIRGGRSHIPNAWIWGVFGILVLGAAALGFRLISSQDGLSRDDLAIIRQLSSQRPGNGRLSFASDSLNITDKSDISRAQLYALSLPTNEVRLRIQYLIHLAQGESQKAVQILERLTAANPGDTAILNDLAVAYLADASNDPLKYFRSLSALELAMANDKQAVAPRFNAVLIYQAIGLRAVAEHAKAEYAQLERDQKWARELESGPNPKPTAVLEQLRVTLQTDPPAADLLFDNHVEILRRAATDYALDTSDPLADDAAVAYIDTRLRSKYNDRTLQAMLDPLRRSDRNKVIEARKLVRAGTDAYLGARLSDSLRFYDRAAETLSGVESTFDLLWVDLNRADAENRIGNIQLTKTLLDRVIQRARQNNLQWVLGLALTSRGSGLPLADSFTNLLANLSESQAILQQIGASQDSSRALYYSAISNYLVGNFEDSAQLTFSALKVTRNDDYIRRSQLFWLAASLLHRFGFPHHAALFQEESVSEAFNTGNLPVLGTAMAYLASMYEANLQFEKAEEYMKQARATVADIAEPIQRLQVNFSLNLVCGRVELRRANPDMAIECVQGNLEFFRNNQSPLRSYLSQALLIMGKAYQMSGNTEQAREEFRKAIDVVEEDDNNLVTDKFRLPYENERRDLYETAIGFEFNHGDAKLAWSYAQRYRSKLFLEFLGQSNPQVRTQRASLTSGSVHEMIPSDLQVIEYVILKDELLVWVLSDRLFESKSIPVSRISIDSKVTDFIQTVRNSEETAQKSEELYGLLIEPIAHLLDSSKTIAIIADQTLNRLPFAALRSRYANRFLIEDYALVESPNLTHLLASSTDQRPSRALLAPVGARVDEVSALRELSAVSKLYPANRVLVGDSVNRAAFLSAMATASVFHYAGHSQDASDPLRSSILLDGSRAGPNSVTAVDISLQKMRPNSVVVLASCDSSVGNSRDGIGMRGLTSAFLISGAGSVVGSLWPVETTSTSDLMIRFHESFAKTGTPVAQALRLAQLSFLKDHPEKSHPYYWSGFVVTGNASALR